MITHADAMVAPGVTRSSGTHALTYTGTKDALIAAGLARQEWFPAAGERNTRGQVVRFKELIFDGRQIRVESPARGLCTVCVWHTPEECAANVAQEKLQEAIDAEKQELQKLPVSAEVAREAFLSVVNVVVGGLHREMRNGIGGYHFDADAIEEARGALEDLCGAIGSGRMIFDPARRARCVHEIRVRTVGAAANEAAESDGSFRDFMERVTKS